MEDIKNGAFDVPQRLQAAKGVIETIVKRADNRPTVRDASKDVVVRLKKQVIEESPEFKALREMPRIQKARIISQTAAVDIRQSGVTHTERDIKAFEIQNDSTFIPDVLAAICEETLTTERTIFEIIKQSGRVKDLINNPQLFIEKCVQIIKQTRYELAIDGIKYLKLDGEAYYLQGIFDSSKLMATLDKNAVADKNSVYDYVIYDSSTVEKPFAKALDDDDEDIKMFFKLPQNFKVRTPIGNYNPDWAVYLDKDGHEGLYWGTDVEKLKEGVRFINLWKKEGRKVFSYEKYIRALRFQHFCRI